MCTVKKKASRRISVWVLVFALILSIGSISLALNAHAASWMDEMGNDARHAADQAGDAVRDAGAATEKAVEDMMDVNVSEGRVRDGDGRIGNEAEEPSVENTMGSDSSVGWLGWSIAIVVAITVIVLTVMLVPKYKER